MSENVLDRNLWLLVEDYLNSHDVTQLACVDRLSHQRHTRRELRICSNVQETVEHELEKLASESKTLFKLVLGSRMRTTAKRETTGTSASPAEGFILFQTRRQRRGSKKPAHERQASAAHWKVKERPQSTLETGKFPLSFRNSERHPQPRPKQHAWDEADLWDLSPLVEDFPRLQVFLSLESWGVHVNALNAVFELKHLRELELWLCEWTLHDVHLTDLSSLKQVRRLLLNLDDSCLDPPVLEAICDMPALIDLTLDWGWAQEFGPVWTAHSHKLKLRRLSFSLLLPENTIVSLDPLAETLESLEVWPTPDCWIMSRVFPRLTCNCGAISAEWIPFMPNFVNKHFF
jgi:hypothetical protein